MARDQFERTEFAVKIITNFTLLPFALSTLCYYIYNFLFNDFRSLKFGLLLLLILFVFVTQVTALSGNDHPLNFRKSYFYYIQNYSYMLTPAKTWLFSAQYFESASLVVQYNNKTKI